MDVLLLSRLQFAVTCMFHFLFVPLTLGLSIMIAWMETRYVMTGDETWLRMTRFWGKLFLINFALGVVTGITMEFQFGMNWAEYSRYVGDIFGAPLAIEATVSFFLESVFIGVWLFGWNKVSKTMHAVAIWLVAIATNLSGLWIILANGWMQHPVGYVIRNNRAEMVDFWAMVTNPTGLLMFGHQIVSGYTVAAFFVLGISAWHILRKNEMVFFQRSFRQAALFGLASTLLVALMGDLLASNTAKVQPAKFAAMELVWETRSNAAMHLLLLPDTAKEKNSIEALSVPGALSFLAFKDTAAEVKGLKEFPPALRPPLLPVFLSFRAMVALGGYFILACLLALYFSSKGTLERQRWFLTLLIFSIPLPYLANQLGWIVSEMGRQPWIVYGVLKTADAVSRNITPAQVIFSLAGFTVLYSALGALDFFLLAKYARKGPEQLSAGQTSPQRRN